MIAMLRISLMVVALALLAGAVFACWQRDVPWALLYFALSGMCIVLAMIAREHVG